MRITLGTTNPDLPDSQAFCPTCKKLVHCNCLRYVSIYPQWNMTLKHYRCGTKWKIDLHDSSYEILEGPNEKSATVCNN